MYFDVIIPTLAVNHNPSMMSLPNLVTRWCEGDAAHGLAVAQIVAASVYNLHPFLKNQLSYLFIIACHIFLYSFFQVHPDHWDGNNFIAKQSSPPHMSFLGSQNFAYTCNTRGNELTTVELAVPQVAAGVVTIQKDSLAVSEPAKFVHGCKYVKASPSKGEIMTSPVDTAVQRSIIKKKKK